MTAKRFSYLLITFVLLLGTAVIGLGVAGNIFFQKQSVKLTKLKAQSQAVKEQEISLAQAKKDVEKYKELGEIAKSVVPKDKDQAKTVREINAIAAESGIKLNQIDFSTSSLGQAAAKPAAPAEESGGEPKPQQAARPTLSQVKPVPGIDGVYSLEIIIMAGDEKNPIPYYQFLQFLEKLEANRRTAHVSKIGLTPSNSGNGVSFSLTLNAYLKP